MIQWFRIPDRCQTIECRTSTDTFRDLLCPLTIRTTSQVTNKFIEITTESDPDFSDKCLNKQICWAFTLSQSQTKHDSKKNIKCLICLLGNCQLTCRKLKKYHVVRMQDKNFDILTKVLTNWSIAHKNRAIYDSFWCFLVSYLPHMYSFLCRMTFFFNIISLLRLCISFHSLYNEQSAGTQIVIYNNTTQYKQL